MIKVSEDIVGKTYHYLTVLERVEDRIFSKGTKTPVWKCQCKCGNIVDVAANKLKNGITKSCSCYRKENVKPRYNNTHWHWKGVGEITGTYWNQVFHRAKRNNIPLIITIEEGWELFLKQDRKCAFSGVLLDFKKNYKQKILPSASLDRIDSNGPYSVDNTQWVHRDLNYMKMNLPNQKFIDLCRLVSDYQKDFN